MKLRTYFALSFALIILLVIASVSTLYGQRTKTVLEKEIGGQVAALAYGMTDKLDRYMWSRYNEIMLLSTLNTLKEQEDLKEVSRLLNELQDNIPAFSWVALLDAQGNVRAATKDLMIGVNFEKRPVFLEALQKPFIGDVHEAVLLAEQLTSPSGDPLKVVDISTPLYDNKGMFTGILAAQLSWEWSQELQKSLLAPYHRDRKQELEVFVLREKDNTVLSGPEDMIGQLLHLTDLETLSTDNKWDVRRWPDGKQYLTGFAQSSGYGNYPGLGWRIVVRQPAELAFAPVQELIAFMTLLGLALAVACALIGWLLARKVSRPLSLIAEAANKLRRGENAEIPYSKGIKDIELLSSSLRSLIADLTETETQLVRMEDKAHHDKLTGLLNRSAMDGIVQRAVRQAEEQRSSLSFVYMDLDGFKNINDTHGHAAGDELLKEVAARLWKNARSGDYLFRMGGDEFVLILSVSQANAEQEAEAVATSVLEAVRQPYEIDGKIMGVSCSIGLAMWPQDDRDPLSLLRDADEALYASKSKGKNQLTFARSSVTV
ncbi:sensor domain-containing diguanylate cyclase [Paenibacillus sp. PAMC21692]|uniref:sensor domain-containing diguanylate cyclase n=1 Tax=Paenibacillus sp. PAMC21692 TaxID=2762320 RepID=UPI00164D3B72|nr:sensor domain-containing diguanylate cyclase [Paenibacillus sp. PAMC21692]QNK57173.1 GGDEF domain-containing protein [Paenibacillus sp. PAMC21692]